MKKGVAIFKLQQKIWIFLVLIFTTFQNFFHFFANFQNFFKIAIQKLQLKHDLQACLSAINCTFKLAKILRSKIAILKKKLWCFKAKVSFLKKSSCLLVRNFLQIQDLAQVPHSNLGKNAIFKISKITCFFPKIYTKNITF